MPTRYRKLSILSLFLVALSLVAAACGAEEPTGDCLAPVDGALVAAECVVPAGATAEPTPTASSSNGGTIDPGFTAFRASGCSGCHAIDGTSASGQLGPNLTYVAAKGGAEYIHESIVDPSAVIAQDCPSGPCSDGIMPKNYGTVLPAADIDAIVAYLAGL
ncbi:MAG: c-type cytochrome [Chloroflexi bacterium]|nr:c-type cytochrome [Chloroflexota bacterium]